MPRRRRPGKTDPCDPPPLCLIRVVEKRIWVAEHLGSELWREMLHGKAMVVAKNLGRLVHELGWRLAHGRVETTHVVVHGWWLKSLLLCFLSFLSFLKRDGRL